MMRALKYASAFDMLLMQHTEEKSLTQYGSMNSGALSTKLGNKGKPEEAEDIKEALQKKEEKDIKEGKKVMFGGKWSLKYKRSINCRKPKGFSQKQYCKRKNKKSKKKRKKSRKKRKRKRRKTRRKRR